MLNIIILIFSIHSRKAKIIIFIKNFFFSFCVFKFTISFWLLCKEKKNMIEAMVVPRNSNGIKRGDEPKSEPWACGLKKKEYHNNFMKNYIIYRVKQSMRERERERGIFFLFLFETCWFFLLWRGFVWFYFWSCEGKMREFMRL
jgi:hypothetical protein